ncbi:GtrA family protein [Rhodoferax sp.]|uniref:GtrA family protein n=1 Tax=Rhodoferax sp. TaxID=50421 RepID=UPI00374D8572
MVVRFVLVGILNTSVSYLIYALLLSVGVSYQMANLIALVIGILFSFKTQGHLVFNNRNNRLLGRFILSWIFIYLCVIFLIGRIIDFGLDAYTAGALALPFSAVLSYVIQKYFVFKGPAQPTQR